MRDTAHRMSIRVTRGETDEAVLARKFGVALSHPSMAATVAVDANDLRAKLVASRATWQKSMLGSVGASEAAGSGYAAARWRRPQTKEG